MSQPETPDDEFLSGLVVGWASGEAEDIVRPAPQGRRYFPATAMAGCLYVEGLSDRGSRDPARLVYWTEEQVDRVLNERVGDRKVRSADELREALRESKGRAASIKVWIAEGLEDPATLEWMRSSGQR